MQPTFTWTIEGLTVLPVLEEFTQVVTSINWRLTASNEEHECSSFGSVNLNYENPQEFLDYSTLTEPQIIEWLIGSLNSVYIGQSEKMKELLAIQLGKLSASEVSLGSLPWETI